MRHLKAMALLLWRVVMCSFLELHDTELKYALLVPIGSELHPELLVVRCKRCNRLMQYYQYFKETQR